MKKTLLSIAIFGLGLANINAQIYPTSGLIEYFSFDNTLIGSEGSILVSASSNFTSGFSDEASTAYGISISTNKLKSDDHIWQFPAANQDFSVSFWFKLNTNTTASLFNIRGYEGEEINSNLIATGMAYSSNKLIISKVEMGSFTETEINYSYNSDWHHLVLTHVESGNTNYIYIDGVLLGSTTLELNTPDFANTRLQIGQSPGGAHFGDFSIDEFLMYDRVISSNEINAIMNQSVSLNDLTAKSFSVFPNPAKDFIQLSNLIIGSQIEILDISGKTISSFSNDSETVSISTMNFNSGVYFVNVLNSDGMKATQKFIVE